MRLCIIRVTYDFLATILIGGSLPFTTDLPGDTRIERIVEPCPSCSPGPWPPRYLDLVVASDEFPEVKEGARIPARAVKISTEEPKK